MSTVPTTTANTTADTAADTTPTAPASQKVHAIHALMNFGSLLIAQLIILALAVVKGFTTNPAFTHPPIDIPTFTATVTALQTSAINAQTGDRNAIAVREKNRKVVVQGLKQLALYAENNCDDDPSVFFTSGFLLKSTVRTAPQPVAAPWFKFMDHGSNSGALVLRIQKVTGAKSYNVRYAAMNGTVPGPWIILQVALANKKITVSNLTPGTIYGFQVQALGTLGLSDFSTLETMMAT